jgi:ATP-dependent Lhr-like helicase
MHQAHLERAAIEPTLAELATQDFLQRHGFKNRYGGGERLWDLVDHKLIYGNFPLGSQSVDVVHHSRVLGTVPAINLLRITRGMTVRFAGKRWRIREASNEGIEVEPSPGRGGAVDFIYPGEGAGFDAFMADRIWKLLHSPEPPLDLVATNLRLIVSQSLERFRAACKADQIPFFRTLTGTRYLTFGGYLVNKAAALLTKQPDFKADEFTLEVVTPIEWQKLPSKAAGFESVFHSLFETSSGQSIFQTFLPQELQRHEFLQEWLKSQAVEAVVGRLATSRAVRVEPNLLSL